MAMKARMKGGPRNTITGLAKAWPGPQRAFPLGSARPTPAVIDAERDGQALRQMTLDAGERGARKGISLHHEVANWVTPTAAIAAGGQTSRSGDRKDELLLTGQATSLSGPLDPTTSTDGAQRSTSGLQLNPLFVEWLMGWPRGWTSLASSFGDAT